MNSIFLSLTTQLRSSISSFQCKNLGKFFAFFEAYNIFSCDFYANMPENTTLYTLNTIYTNGPKLFVTVIPTGSILSLLIRYSDINCIF